MKTKRIINKKDVMKELLATMFESACTQKKLLEMLLEEIEAEESKPTPIKDEPRELIKGISGLAEFLSCGTTKAQSIMNSGILQDRNIAYSAGNCWRFNKTLLAELLQEEPEIFNSGCSEVA
jgi:hypothetical protein